MALSSFFCEPSESILLLNESYHSGLDVNAGLDVNTGDIVRSRASKTFQEALGWVVQIISWISEQFSYGDTLC